MAQEITDKVTLTQTSAELWLVEVELEGDDNVYKTQIIACSEEAARVKAQDILEQVRRYRT